MRYSYTPQQVNPFQRISFIFGGYGIYIWFLIAAIFVILGIYLLVKSDKQSNDKKIKHKKGAITGAIIILIIGLCAFTMGCIDNPMGYLDHNIYQLGTDRQMRTNNGNTFDQTVYNNSSTAKYDLVRVTYNPYANKFTIKPETNSGRTYYRVTSYLEDKVQSGDVVTDLDYRMTPNYTFAKFQDSNGKSSVLCSVNNSNSDINAYNSKQKSQQSQQNNSNDASSDDSTDTSDSDGDSAYDSDSDNVQDLKQAKVLKY